MRRIVTTCTIALSLMIATIAQNNEKPQDVSSSTSKAVPEFVDPGFESFTPAAHPSRGWYSDELVVSPNHPRFGEVVMRQDSQFKVEGNFSLRIEQFRNRPKGRGQVFLAQSVRLPNKPGTRRDFDLTAQMRGGLDGSVTIHIYVWEPGNFARAIAERNIRVDKKWRTVTVSFKVPKNYDQFGVWFYLPRDVEAQLWLDDIRLIPRAT